MSASLPPVPDELDRLRQLIADLATRCGVDPGDRRALRLLLDAPESPAGEEATQDPRHELRTLLTLLYRLEAACSEDIGLAGLRRLWHLCAEAHNRQGEPCCSR